MILGLLVSCRPPFVLHLEEDFFAVNRGRVPAVRFEIGDSDPTGEIEIGDSDPTGEILERNVLGTIYDDVSVCGR